MWRGCGTKSCEKGIQDGFSYNCKSTQMRAWRTPSLKSGKLRQLPVVWRSDWRGSIVPKQPLSLAAYFLSASIVFLSQGFSGKHRKNPSDKNKNTPNKCCDARHSHWSALQSFLLPLVPPSHLGLAPELAQALGTSRSFLQTRQDSGSQKAITDDCSSITTVQKVRQGWFSLWKTGGSYKLCVPLSLSVH